MRYLIIITILSTLFRCGIPSEIKTVNWNGNKIIWTVLDGGATTSYYWKIYFAEQGSNWKDLIFESYSSPYIIDISIDSNNLKIHCYGVYNSTEYITINLNNIDDFVDNPIEYERTILKQTNLSYAEPEFIKKEREFAIKHNLTN